MQSKRDELSPGTGVRGVVGGRVKRMVGNGVVSEESVGRDIGEEWGAKKKNVCGKVFPFNLRLELQQRVLFQMRCKELIVEG